MVLSLLRAFCPNVKQTDLNESFFAHTIKYGPNDFAPGAEGTFREGDDTLVLNESLAFLADRQKKPVPFVDRYSPDSGKPPVLHFERIGTASDGVGVLVQFYWGY